MKIAISASGTNKDSLLDVRFGRCEYFQIYNIESGEVLVAKNEGLDCSGGAGIIASQQLIDQGVNVIITGHLGPNAFEIIEKAKIKAYKCNEVIIEVVLEKYKNNELEEIKISGEAHKGMR